MAKPLYDGAQTVHGPLAGMIQAQPGAIVSKPLIDTGALKQILFAMDGGQELSDHRAPYVATIHMLEGALHLQAGDTNYAMLVGDWVIMPANLPHSLIADIPAKFLLTLAKG